MEALVLERKGELNLRDIDIPEKLGPNDVRIALRTVGVCGSDVHYYTHGRIGPFVVEQPLVLGHEASGVVVDVGSDVTHLRKGDRVCMEPGIPDRTSKASMLGMYNLDPSVSFWATPPVHGVMRPEVIHPADFTFRLPDNVSYAEGAMVEPLAVGMHAANKAGIKPGDVAVVMGAGTIGMVTILSALAGGCSDVVVTDVKQPKLDLARSLGAVHPVNVETEDPVKRVAELTDGWGADLLFEASGNPKVVSQALELLKPGGRLIYIGMPVEPVQLDVVQAQAKEISFETIFRYAHVYPRALKLMGSGKIDVKPLITETYPFEQSVDAYDYSVDPKPDSVKVQIQVGSD
jgi:D-xylulose reductase